jgi:hypothetical protein
MRNHLVTQLVTHKWQNQNIFFCVVSKKLPHFKPKPQISLLFKNARTDSLGSTKLNVLGCLITWYNFNVKFVTSVSTSEFNKDKPYIIAWCVFHQFLEMFLFQTLTYDFKTTSTKSIQYKIKPRGAPTSKVDDTWAMIQL